MLSIVLLLRLVDLLQFSLALPVKPPPNIGALTVQVLANASVSASAPPPGFNVDIDWNADYYTFESRELWTFLVWVQFHFAGYGPNQAIRHAVAMSLPISGGSILINPPNPRDLYFTRTSFGEIVWGLYEIGNEMALRYPIPLRAARFAATVKVGEVWKALIVDRRPSSQSIEPVGTPQIDSIATVRRALEQSLEAGHGRISCRDDPDLVIEYEFLGQTLIAGDVFTTFLASGTVISEYDDQNWPVRLIAQGRRSAVRFGIRAVEQGTGRNQITWGHARMAIKTIWREIIMGISRDAPTHYVQRSRWESLYLVFWYRGMKVGEGALQG